MTDTDRIREDAAVTDRVLAHLENGPRHPLGHIHNHEAVKYRPGVYTLWRGEEFLYVGMSYRASDPTPEVDGKWGLWGRIRTHHSSRPGHLTRAILSRFVIPSLTPDDVDAMRQGDDDLLDQRLLEFVDNEIDYRAWISDNGDDARQVENLIRRDGLPRAGQPLLNPK